MLKAPGNPQSNQRALKLTTDLMSRRALWWAMGPGERCLLGCQIICKIRRAWFREFLHDQAAPSAARAPSRPGLPRLPWRIRLQPIAGHGCLLPFCAFYPQTILGLAPEAPINRASCG